jgi:hypothetical protein
MLSPSPSQRAGRGSEVRPWPIRAATETRQAARPRRFEVSPTTGDNIMTVIAFGALAGTVWAKATGLI